MDLVERQKVVDALLGITAMRNTIPLDSAIFNIKKLPSAQPEVLACGEGKLSAQPEQRWIPCSERLPEEGMNCLVCDKGSVAIDTFIGHGNPYNWKWYTRDYEAWMPLPEPWRGEKQ